MDGDPAVEPQLDSFSLTFPLPYRVGFIVTLGWCACATINRISFYVMRPYADNLLSTDSCLGMGPQPPLAACLSNRRSLLNPISRTKLAATHITSFIDIPTRNSSVGSLLSVHHDILALHLARAVQGY